MPSAEEIMATSMLLGDFTPVICSCCLGKQYICTIFGARVSCSQCHGTGYDAIGRETRKIMGLPEPEAYL